VSTSALQRYLVGWATLVVLLVGTGVAQTPGTGAIAGTVYDPSGHVVANADVLVVNDATNTSRAVTTSATGLLRVALLSPGTYTVTVKDAGFATNTSSAIVVRVSETSSLNVTLAVASASASVQVSADAEVADLESSTLGFVVDEVAIESLPLSNRNYTQILGLAPGVIVDLPNAAQLGRGTQNVASNGATPTANNLQFNGVDANNLYENSASNAESAIVGTAIPAPDTIQEFRIQTANFDAAYGRGTGANVDLVSKSGTNRFHGSAWEFVRNNVFNANDFFSKLDGQPRPDLKQNQFGGAIGGPIFKQKTFFFVSYQGLTEVNGLGDEQHPIIPLLTADRSATTLGAQFCPAGHLNNQGQPATGYLTQAGGVQVACDGSNINPVAVAILNTKLANGQFAVPSPQTPIPNSGPDPTDQFPVGTSTFAIPAHYREDQFTVNLDQNLRDNNLLSGRFFYSRAPTIEPFSPNGAANVPGWGTDALDRNTMFVLADTQTFRSSLVNVARFGYIRFDGLSEVQNPITAQAIGIGTPTGAVGPTLNAPGISVGGWTIGDAGTPSEWQVTNSFIYQDTASLTKGRQNARFGIEFKRHEVDVDSPNETDGLLNIPTFNDFLLGQSAAQNGSPFGASNVAITQSGGGIFRRNIRFTDFAIFAQDDVKVLPRLTLNLGLRYEIFGAPTETGGRLANFDADIATQGPVPATYNGFTVPSNFQSTIPAGVVQNSYAGLWKTQHGDVSPRLGFAWQLTDRPVIVMRGGFGVYYDQHSAGIVESGLSQPPYSTGNFIQGTANGPATLQSPYVPLVLPNSAYPIFVTRSAASPLPFTQGTDPNIKDAQTLEYNLNFQYAPGRDWVAQVGYVGTRSVHRPGQLEFNQSLLASPQNPIDGETTNSVNNVTARQPYQGVPQGSLFARSIFTGNYNSLQISITKRMSHGFQLLGSYVWSKNLDELNGEGGTDTFETQIPSNNQHDLRRFSYGLAGDDRDQRAVVAFIWSAPTFESMSPLPRHILTDWQFSGIGVIQSGAALSIFDGNAGSVYGNFNNRAQATGSNPLTHGSLFSRVVGTGRYLDATAFTRAPEAPFGTSLADQDFGNSSVGLVRGPGQHNVDVAIERVFPVAERSSFQFRTEFFNLTNTPQFANPNTGLGYGDPTLPVPTASSSFGEITSTVTNPRIIQFALKYQF
jgi:hypothetical protein